MATGPFTGAKNLRTMLKEGKMVTCPGVYDGLTARIALSVGFDALYMTGAGTSMSKLGWADLGLATLNDMHANAEMIASLDTSVPLIADADTGYGGPIMVARTVAKYARAGVAALHIEDQVQEKRCGHLMGKEVVPREVWYSRLRSAVTARNELQSDIMIIARTDSRQKLGFDEAIERLKGAVEIGADILFLEALQSREEARKVCQIMGETPVLLNMVPTGLTKELSIDDAKELGFRMVIVPTISFGSVLVNLKKDLEAFKKEGTHQTRSAGGPREMFEMCGLADLMALDKKAGGQAYEGV